MLLQLGKRVFNPRGGIWLLPFHGQGGHRVPQGLELILVGLFPLLEVSQLLPVGLGQLFDKSIDVHRRPANDRCNVAVSLAVMDPLTTVLPCEAVMVG